ncbi:efflux RND transporter periplasmic adaptor subunit [Endozoicomonadaceae bacterium StTr2]
MQQEAPVEQLKQLWTEFSQANRLEHYYQSWLELQAARVGAEGALLTLCTEQQLQPVATCPADNPPDPALLSLLEEVVEKDSGLVQPQASGIFMLALPLRMDSELMAVIAMKIRCDAARLPAIMEQLQWGGAWVELLQYRVRSEGQDDDIKRMSTALECLAAVMAEQQFDAAAMAFVNELAIRFNCQRVSLGFRKGEYSKVVALSHSAEFGHKMNLVRSLGQVMDEAILQRTMVQWPPRENQQTESLVLREHRQLAKEYETGTLLTVPLHSGEDYYGAVILEAAGTESLSAAQIAQVQSVTALCGELLRDRKERDRSILNQTGLALKTQLQRLIGKGYFGRKLTAAGLLILIAFFSVAEGDYRIAADSTLEGTVRRAIVAPFEGYIETAPARAGDQVSAGELLSQMDDRDFRLDRISLFSEQAKLKRQYEEAMARGKPAEAMVIKAQIEQAAARLKLAESKLQRTRLTAPFDGLIVSGDLSQQLGGVVEQGEVLFEIAPLDSYRVILWVDEHQIGDISDGMPGQLVLNARPDDTYPLKVSRITSITEAKDGGNYFRVEAALENDDLHLRPGMQGIAKVSAGDAKLIWIWTRPLLQWLELKAWEWWP